MPRGGLRPNSGRPRKTIQAPKLAEALSHGEQEFATALEWCMATLNDPNVPTDLKARVAAAVLPFQTPKIESVAGPGKKEQAEAAAREASVGIFAPGQPPTKRN